MQAKRVAALLARSPPETGTSSGLASRRSALALAAAASGLPLAAAAQTAQFQKLPQLQSPCQDDLPEY